MLLWGWLHGSVLLVVSCYEVVSACHCPSLLPPTAVGEFSEFEPFKAQQAQDVDLCITLGGAFTAQLLLHSAVVRAGSSNSSIVHRMWKGAPAWEVRSCA